MEPKEEKEMNGIEMREKIEYALHEVYESGYEFVKLYESGYMGHYMDLNSYDNEAE